MWQIESYTIEIRNTSFCETDDNLVVSKHFDAKDLQSGHNTVDITGLCPSMQYWYCTKAVWVQYYLGMEMSRKTVTETGLFITEDSTAETEDWDVSSGPCAGTEPTPPVYRPGGVLTFRLSNVCPDGDTVGLPYAMSVDHIRIPVDNFQIVNVSNDGNTYSVDLRYPCSVDQAFSENSKVVSNDPDYVIIKH